MGNFARNLPIAIVFAVAAGVGTWLIVSALTEDEMPSVSEWDANVAAKVAYYDTDPTVSRANCDPLEYASGTDTWAIECTMEREWGTERTYWRITPDGTAHRYTP